MPFADVIGHEQPKAILRAALAHERLAHAYLFAGESAIGKRQLAWQFLHAVNCEGAPSESPDACGACRSCAQIAARTHPDVLVIEPDREMAHPQIKIEQIRELEQALVYRPLIGRRKVCLIDDADALTIGAANALLKTLEEPTAQSLFILVTGKPAALPATIRSRCQLIRFVAPARTQVEAALILRRNLPPDEARLLAMLTEGRLGLALGLDLQAVREQQQEFAALAGPATLRSVAKLLTAAESLAKAGRAQEALEWLTRWIRDLLLVRVGADRDSILHLERLAELTSLARQVEAGALLDVLDLIQRLERQASRNLNPQMMLEQVLLRLRDALGAELPAGRK